MDHQDSNERLSPLIVPPLHGFPPPVRSISGVSMSHTLLEFSLLGSPFSSICSVVFFFGDAGWSPVVPKVFFLKFQIAHWGSSLPANHCYNSCFETLRNWFRAGCGRWSSREVNPWQDTQGAQHFTSQAKMISKAQVEFCCPWLSCHYKETGESQIFIDTGANC